jgi:hypothetical protein
MNVDAYLKVILECDDKENSKVIFYDKAYELSLNVVTGDWKVYITKEGIWKVKEVRFFMGSRN